ncbi:hypothetical protein [Enterococcus sp. AZ109]|uniref:hypothetical protein n=1 Tax=Enterococcus sp. AZ109 TaxID=2774634 RepID=UPI003F1F5B6E
MKKGQKMIVYGLVVAILLATGITVKLGLDQRSAAQDQATRLPSTNAASENEAELLKQADTEAKQYDYDEAIKLLQDSESKETQAQVLDYELQKKDLITWSDPTLFPHLSVQPLVISPEKAFSATKNYQRNNLTIDEFKQLLNELYERDFVLVRLSDMVKKQDNGEWEFVGVSLPDGKKPLLLSQENVSYNEETAEAGLSSKLVVDRDNRVKSCYRDGDNELAGNYDMVPLVDQFIWQHPEFSYRGSKGTLAVTGADGVFGYDVSETGTAKDIERATAVADRLKETGWTLASYSWAPINFNYSTLAIVQQDTVQFKADVEPIIGETPLLMFPEGSDIGTWQPYNECNPSYVYLKDEGFSIFSQQDATQESWGEFTPAYYRNARIMVTGADLAAGSAYLAPFMDTADVLDEEARGI